MVSLQMVQDIKSQEIYVLYIHCDTCFTLYMKFHIVKNRQPLTHRIVNCYKKHIFMSYKRICPLTQVCREFSLYHCLIIKQLYGNQIGQ